MSFLTEYDMLFFHKKKMYKDGQISKDNSGKHFETKLLSFYYIILHQSN